MPQRIKCPTGHSLIVPDDRAGRSLRCPRCGESVLVPGEPVVAATLAAESPPPMAVDAALSQVVAEPARSIAIAAPPKPSRPKPQKTIPSNSQPRPAPPVVKPKSCVLPTPPINSPPEPVSVDPPKPIVLAQPEVKTSLANSPPQPAAAVIEVQQPVQEEAVANPRLGGSLTLPEQVALPESPPVISIAAEGPPEPVVQPPPAAALPLPDPPTDEPAHESSGDIAAFLSLQFSDQPVPAAPRRTNGTSAADPLDADISRTLGVYQLAAALVVAALFSVAPAVWDLIEYVRIDDLDAPFVARWALVLFFVGIVQLAYAVYLFQLPDWATVWVVTIFQLLLAASYAAVLGMVLISDGDGLLVGQYGLQLADKLAGGKAALWCLCMVSVATILAFFAGRMSVRWRQAERVLQSVQMQA
jgi:hypothetical protein